MSRLRLSLRSSWGIAILVLALLVGGEILTGNPNNSRADDGAPISRFNRWHSRLSTATEVALAEASLAAEGLNAGLLPESAEIIQGIATRYGGGPDWGDTVNFNGNTMGCGGIYSSYDESIAAVGPSRYFEWPCGTLFYICGPVGCNLSTRRDACPGCSSNHLDLSEVAHQKVCGVGTCPITIEVVSN